MSQNHINFFLLHTQMQWMINSPQQLGGTHIQKTSCLAEIWKGRPALYSKELSQPSEKCVSLN